MSKDYTHLLDEIGENSELTTYNDMSWEHEYKLMKKAHRGHREAQNKLVEANLQLAFIIAKKWGNGSSYIDTDHAISCAMYGLIRAARKVDPDKLPDQVSRVKRSRFIHYANHWIKRELIHGERRSEPIIIPEDAFRARYKAYKQKDELGYVDLESIADDINCTTNVIKTYLKSDVNFVSMDEKLGNQTGEDKKYKDVFGSSYGIEEKYASKEATKLVRDYIHDYMDERTARLVSIFLGFDSEYIEPGDRSFNDVHHITSDLHMTRERKRQIIRGALEDLQKNKKFRRLVKDISPNYLPDNQV